MPLPLSSSFKLHAILADCSLLLPAESLTGVKAVTLAHRADPGYGEANPDPFPNPNPKQVPLARRAARDELESTRAAIQVFLLTRHARNLLLHMPDDVRSLSRPDGDPLPVGTLLQMPAASQLMPCTLHVHGRAPQACRLILSSTEPSSVAQPPVEPSAPNSTPLADSDAPTSGDDYALAGAKSSSEVGAATRAFLIVVAAAPTSASAGASPEDHVAPAGAGSAQVVLSVPLSALTLAVLNLRLVCRVPRHHMPAGVSAEHPMQLEFDELWRCSAAKTQIEAACTAARSEQQRRLVALLGPSEPK